MAPSGGSTSLGTQAHNVDEFLTITQEEILNWTPQRLRRQCFQFGLVSEAPEGDVTTLRAVFLEHWRAAVSAATQATKSGGAGAHCASECPPRSLGRQSVSRPASPLDAGVPCAPSVPFLDGVCARPERDLTPVPWDLDPEDFAAVDALDSRAEGLVLTPGRDPYASCRGETPETPDAATPGAGDDCVHRPRTTPSGPSMACYLSGGISRGTPRGAGALHGDEDDYAPSGCDNEAMDDMDSEIVSDGGGPWQRARGPKRRTKDRSPQGTPRRGAHGRPNLGPTPMKVRELPSVPSWARDRGDPANDAERRQPRRTNIDNENGDTDGRARPTAQGAAGDPAAVADQSTTGARSPLRSRSASPRIAWGAPTDTSAPTAPNEAPAMDAEPLCGAYARLTNQCWANLVRLSERPDKRELVALQEKSLHALIKAAGGTYGNDWRKPRLAQSLLDWLEQHPGQPLPLPLGRCRDQRSRTSRQVPDPPPRMPDAANREHGGRGAKRRTAHNDVGGGATARNDAGGSPRQGPDDVPMTDAAGGSPKTNAGASSPSAQRDRRAPIPPPTGRLRDAHRAAEVLRASSRELLATMDAVAELFERAHRGEDCSKEDGATVAAMVDKSREILRGIATGFAAADLIGSLKQATEDVRRPRAPPSATAMGGRTYAQAARTGALPTDIRPEAPLRQPPSVPWAPERTVLLHPVDNRQRQAPTRASEFGAELDRVLRSDLALERGPAVELVRRTAKGEYAVQFATVAWEQLQTDRTLSLPSFGRWSRRVADPARRQRNSVVLQGVPKTMTPDQVARDLLHGNGDRWKGLPGAALDDVRVERLNRRVPAPGGQDSRSRSQWLPSATVRVFASTALCTAILEGEGAVVGYSFRPARPFERAPIRCYRCGEMGFHVGKFCRNKPRCRHCGKGHQTSHCPDRQHDHPLGNTAGGPPQGAAQTL